MILVSLISHIAISILPIFSTVILDAFLDDEILPMASQLTKTRAFKNLEYVALNVLNTDLGPDLDSKRSVLGIIDEQTTCLDIPHFNSLYQMVLNRF